MEKVFNVAKAISSMLAGEASDEQQREIEDWRQGSEENARLLSKMMDNEYLKKDRESLARFDKEEAWRKICEKQGIVTELPKREEIRRIGPIWKYVAAVMILALGSGMWWWLAERKQEVQVVEIAQEIRENEGHKGVILRLQNGK